LLGVVVVVGWSCGQAHLHDQERDRVVAELDADEPDWRWRARPRTREDLAVEQDLTARVLALATRIPHRTPLDDLGEHPVWRGSWDDPPAYAAVRA
jgi:hypothetical protein